MAKLRLDLEEWQSVFRTLVAVPSEDQTPCLKSAIVGVGMLLTNAGSEMAQHDCEKSECEKALLSAAQHLREGRDPYQIDLEEEVAENIVEEDPEDELFRRVTALENAVFGVREGEKK